MKKAWILGLLLASLSLGPVKAEPWKHLSDGDGYLSASGETLRVSRAPQDAARVLEVARLFAGRPYVWAGHDPTQGFDCSGYVYEVMRLCGYEVPRMADEQFHQTTRVAYKDLRPGDLVFFHTYLPGPSHVGFYMGNGDFIHASSAAEGVVVSQMRSGYYKERFLGGGRPSGWLMEPLPVAETAVPAAEVAQVALEEAEEKLPPAVERKVTFPPSPFSRNRERAPQPVRTTVVPIVDSPGQAALEEWSLVFGETVAMAELQVKSLFSAFSTALGSVRPGG